MNNLSHNNFDAIEHVLALIDQMPDDDDTCDIGLEEIERQFAELRLHFGEE